MSLGAPLARILCGLSWVVEKKSKNIKLKKILSLKCLLFKRQMQKQKDLKIGQLDRCTITMSNKQAFSLDWMQYKCCKEWVITGLHFQMWKQWQVVSGPFAWRITNHINRLQHQGRRRNMGLGSLLSVGLTLEAQKTTEGTGQTPISMGSGRALSKEDLLWNTTGKSEPSELSHRCWAYPVQ